jgi:hypothetical protein
MATGTSNTGSSSSYMEDVLGTKYPYINLGEGFISSRTNGIRRALGSANPFAFPQIPSQERMAFGLRRGNGWYNPLPYPNGIVFSKMFPAHFDPLTDEPRKERWQVENFAPGAHSHFVFTADKLPRGCVRTIQNYKRCEMVNSQQSCHQESLEILKVCPTWALDELKEKKRFIAKVAAINAQTYQSAMEVGSYNQGRSLKDISTRTTVDGMRDKLRPDTMWADERYSKITQAEINEAKKRIEERRKKRDEGLGQHIETHHATQGHTEEAHYDYKHVAIKHPKPLYP